MTCERILQIVVDTPVDRVFDYRWSGEKPPEPGQLAVINFSRRDTVGLIIAVKLSSDVELDKLKFVISIHEQLMPLSPSWLDLCRFAADYYQRSLGEVALPAIPKGCRAIKTLALDKALKKIAKRFSDSPAPIDPATLPQLNEEQLRVVEQISQQNSYAANLLFGVTGSGKTEVYMRVASVMLANSSTSQILILVPEINLTPQFSANLQARFPEHPLAIMHSGMAEGERTLNWLAAHSGAARIIVGTRLAVMTSLPNLKLIIVDEEHDASYKQQEGMRYSARDLAIWRARQLDIPVILGSATPSLESWHHAKNGRYQQWQLTKRAVSGATLPSVKLVDLAKDKAAHGISTTLYTAIKQRLERGEQSLIYINRRGYAPVLTCDACGWISNCKNCSTYLVLHKLEKKLRCHHCSFECAVPKSCPDCGNVDIQPLGRGTQRLEEHLQELFGHARIQRIDADSTRTKGSAERAFDMVHRGEVDILVGTQMVAKGHDFKTLTLVGVVNPDTALFSQDYRASERLFAQLMQVSGRAGRAGVGNAQVLIQTRYPTHPLYAALAKHDYPSFAKNSLTERQQAGLPPFVYQAMLRAEAKDLEAAMVFLSWAAELYPHENVIIQSPIPMTLVRIANRERAQLLIECTSRPVLQQYLKEWLPQIRKKTTNVKWSIEVDPAEI